jgi:uncharacterized protein YecE (DUF72 family)
MSGRLHVGTSGFAYPEWKPDFYPAELRNDDMLGYYATKLSSVEINYTFYREPSPKTVEKWASQTPSEFTFTLKANRKITHVRRLGDVYEVLARFLDATKPLGSRLGTILFQFPPTMRYDAEALDAFLALVPGGDMPNACRAAMEFRHASFDDDEVRAKLRANGIAWCVSDTDEHDAAMTQTAEFVYLRLRKLVYDAEALQRWSERVRAVMDAGGDAYVYFKHEDTASGALYALKLRELLGA